MITLTGFSQLYISLVGFFLVGIFLKDKKLFEFKKMVSLYTLNPSLLPVQLGIVFV